MEAALAAEGVGEIVGMRRGVEGLLREEFVDLRRQPPGTLDLLRRTLLELTKRDVSVPPPSAPAD